MKSALTGKVLITGASGFVGGTLAEAFAEDGWHGLGISRKGTALLPGGWRNASRESMLNGSGSAGSDVDAVIHLEVKQHVLNPTARDLEEFQQVNVEGTRQWLEWCERNGVKRFVYFSTIKATEPAGDTGSSILDTREEGESDQRSESGGQKADWGNIQHSTSNIQHPTALSGGRKAKSGEGQETGDGGRNRGQWTSNQEPGTSTQQPATSIQHPVTSNPPACRFEGDPEEPGDTPYGRSKWEAEQLVRQWAEADPGRSALILRPAVVYGPGNTANIYAMVDGIARGRFCLIGANDNIKSVVSKKSLAAATVHLVDRMQPGCEVYYVTDRETMSVREMASIVAQLLGKKGVPTMPAPVATLLAKGGDIFTRLTGRNFPLTTARLEALTETTHFSCAKLLATGFKHPQTMKEGLAEMVEWYRAQRAE